MKIIALLRSVKSYYVGRVSLTSKTFLETLAADSKYHDLSDFGTLKGSLSNILKAVPSTLSDTYHNRQIVIGKKCH